MAKTFVTVLVLAIVATTFAQYSQFPQHNAGANRQFHSRTSNTNTNFNHQQPQVVVNKLTRDDTAEARNQYVTVAGLQAFREYTLSLLRQPSFYDAFQRTGIVSYDTVSLGHILAVVNEKVIDVPNVGIPRVLRLTADQVATTYAGIVDSYVQDSRVTVSSTLYVPDAQRQVTDNYRRLRTVREVLRLYQNVQAPQVINENIRRTTQGVVNDVVVPQVPPFNETVVGVHTNTFYYQSQWVVPFKSVGQRPFYVTENVNVQNANVQQPTTTTQNVHNRNVNVNVQRQQQTQQQQQQQVVVDTIEATGSFPVVVTNTYSAVAVPVVGDRRYVVFVQPKTTVGDFVQNSVSEVFLTTPQQWQKQTVRVQVPAVNITVARNFVSQLNDVAGSQLVCNVLTPVSGQVPVNYIHPIVQFVSQTFTVGGYEVAVANGVQLDRVQNVVRTSRHHNQVPVPVVSDNLRIKTVREVDTETTAQQVPVNTQFVFDRPYFVYVHDVDLGAISFTAVKNPTTVVNVNVGQVVVPTTTQRQIRHVVSNVNFNQDSIVTRWNCGYDEGHVVVDHPQEQIVRDQTPICRTQY